MTTTTNPEQWPSPHQLLALSCNLLAQRISADAMAGHEITLPIWQHHGELLEHAQNLGLDYPDAPADADQWPAPMIAVGQLLQLATSSTKRAVQLAGIGAQLLELGRTIHELGPVTLAAEPSHDAGSVPGTCTCRDCRKLQLVKP